MSRPGNAAARRRIALTAAVGLVVVASLVPSAPAMAQQQTPQQTVRTFIATVNARRADCSLMIDADNPGGTLDQADWMDTVTGPAHIP